MPNRHFLVGSLARNRRFVLALGMFWRYLETRVPHFDLYSKYEGALVEDVDLRDACAVRGWRPSVDRGTMR